MRLGLKGMVIQEAEEDMYVKGLNSDDVWDHENAFYWFSDPSRLLKSLAHWELYKRIQLIPGDVLELGVYKGASLIRFASFRHALESEKSRRILGFDAFGKFPLNQHNLESDKGFIEKFETAGGEGIIKSDLEKVLAAKGFGNVDLVEGDIFDTLPIFLKENPSSRFSLIHFDLDVYAPTKFALELLWDKLVPGGLLVFDDFGAVEGETVAVEEFLADSNYKLSKLPYYSIPSFITK